MKNLSKIYILSLVAFSLLFSFEAKKELSLFANSKSSKHFIYDFSNKMTNSENNDIDHEEKELNKAMQLGLFAPKFKTTNLFDTRNLKEFDQKQIFSPPRS